MHGNHETSPTNPLDPLAHPGVIRIALGPTASAMLTQSGESVFALVSRQTWPADPKRWAIYLLPVSLTIARCAEAVAMGRATARAIKTQHKATSKQ